MRPTITRSLAALAASALIGASVLVLASPAAAAVITTEADLVSAINDANLLPDHDVIELGGAGFTLTADLPWIEEGVTITGPGSAGFTIDGGGWAGFHLENPLATTIEATITGITVTNTTVDSVTAYGVNLTLDDVATVGTVEYGLDFDGGNLTVTNSSFAGALNGNSIYVSGADIAQVSSSSFSDNDSLGLVVDATGTSSITLADLTVSGNGNTGLDAQADDAATLTIQRLTADANGYIGLSVAAVTDATATVTSAALTGNNTGFSLIASSTVPVITTGVTIRDSDQGAIVAAFISGASATLTGLAVSDTASGPGVLLSTVAGSSLVFEGATIADNLSAGVVVPPTGAPQGSVTFRDSTFNTNGSATSVGAYLTFSEGGSIAFERSTFTANTSTTGGAIIALLEDGAALSLDQSTISGNVAEDAAAIAALSSSTGTLTITRSTITGNSSTVGGSAVEAQGVTTTIDHSIISDNTSATAADADLDAPGAAVSYSLVGEPEAATLPALGSGAGNLVGVSAKLGPLADNGGSTLTHLPLPGSPAIDAGNPAVTGAPATDQRGSTRIVRTIDIGAVEVQASVAPQQLLPATGSGSTPPQAPLTGLLLLLSGIAMIAFSRLRTARSVS
ncbi:hypothetical protein BH09ACT5_BH09ACT5_11200 [soil metagenome]